MIYLKFTNKKTGVPFFSVFEPVDTNAFLRRLKVIQKSGTKRDACDVCEVTERTYQNSTKRGAK